MTEPARNSLDAELAKLAREVTPPRNLWPGIARGMERGGLRNPPRHRPMAWAAAAAVAGACLASALTWAVLHGRPESPATPIIAAQPQPSYGDVTTARYVAARDSLEQTFQQRLVLLDPATRAKVEASLATIRKAHEDIRQALVAAPASPVLEQLWESTWQDEFDLYDRVVQATQPTMTRT
jgi:hypothetical protein